MLVRAQIRASAGSNQLVDTHAGYLHTRMPLLYKAALSAGSRCLRCVHGGDE